MLHFVLMYCVIAGISILCYNWYCCFACVLCYSLCWHTVLQLALAYSVAAGVSILCVVRHNLC